MAEILSADQAYGKVMTAAAGVAGLSSDFFDAEAGGAKLSGKQCEMAGAALAKMACDLLSVARHIKPDLPPEAAVAELRRLLDAEPPAEAA